jgi:hypothetical protein
MGGFPAVKAEPPTPSPGPLLCSTLPHIFPGFNHVAVNNINRIKYVALLLKMRKKKPTASTKTNGIQTYNSKMRS